MTPDAQTLRDALDRETIEVRTLLEILGDERRALESNRHDGLLESSRGKQACLERIERAAVARLAILAALDLPADRQGMARCVDRLDPQGRHGLQRSWQDLHALLTACHHLNRVNSQIVQTRLQTSRQTLDLLHGRPPGTVQEYTPDGRTLAGRATTRTLASA